MLVWNPCRWGWPLIYEGQGGGITVPSTSLALALILLGMPQEKTCSILALAQTAVKNWPVWSRKCRDRPYLRKVWLWGRVLLKLWVWVFIVDVVAHTNELLSMVGTGDKNHSHTHSVHLGNEGWVWGISLGRQSLGFSTANQDQRLTKELGLDKLIIQVTIKKRSWIWFGSIIVQYA